MDPIQKLKAEKARILEDARRKAEALDADARELERLQELANKYGLSLVEKTATPDVVIVSGNGETVTAIDVKTPAYKAAINVSENAIKAAGHPLELSELFDACVEKGVLLAGKRPQSTLSAYLSHDASTVHSIRRGMYWLKGVTPPDEFGGLIPSSKAS